MAYGLPDLVPADHHPLPDRRCDGLNTLLNAPDGSYCDYTAYDDTDALSLDPQYPDKCPGRYKRQLQFGVYKPTAILSTSYGA